MIGLHPRKVVTAAPATAEETKRDPYVAFSDANAVSGDYSGPLRELRQKIAVGAIHSGAYYRRTGRVKDNEGPQEILQIQLILKGLSKIALAAMQDGMNSESRIANIEQLAQLQAHVLGGASLGTGNIELADSISLLTSALIFQEMADSDGASWNRLVPFAQRGTANRRYTVEAISDVFSNEIGYKSGRAPTSEYDLLTDVLFQKSPEFAKRHLPEKRVTLDSIITSSLVASALDPGKSRNPLIDVDPLQFVSNFLVVRNLELCAYVCVLDHQLWDENTVDRVQAFERYSRELMSRMTAFEKQMYGDPNDPQDMTRMVERVRGQINGNLRTRGKRILELLHRRFLMLSANSDIRRDND
jgi:hypothetical protein